MNKIPKIIAVYLPQFYENSDNNLWWGKGFTDWCAVKSAEKCFEGHSAPWIPLNNNYYDLNTYETLKWQAEIAKKYGIDGFSFYHYYFENGKMELELPAENLLKWKDIDMPFCFNWASESWIRSWSKISGNVWSEKYEKTSTSDTSGVLVKQNYGGKKEWKKHFDYLLPFFKDSRYIRIDNKPVFIFYNPNEISQLDEMVLLWKKLAAEAGLTGLYIIGVNTNVSGTRLDASMIYEPRKAINVLNESGKLIIKSGVRCFKGSDMWEAIINAKPFVGCKTYFMGVTGYDDTPRRGKKGECIVENDPDTFENGMKQLIKKSIQYGNELVFINAWNEWGEGMYLEPDERWQYEYLASINKAKNYISECTIDSDNLANEYKDLINAEIFELKRECKKYLDFTNILNKWLEAERNGKINFREYFQEMRINSVAIYGMAMLGKQLSQQLKKENIDVEYGIDRYIGQYGEDFDIIRPEEEYPKVDAIIITVHDNEAVITMLRQKSTSKLLILDDIIERFWEKDE